MWLVVDLFCDFLDDYFFEFAPLLVEGLVHFHDFFFLFVHLIFLLADLILQFLPFDSHPFVILKIIIPGRDGSIHFGVFLDLQVVP